MGGACDAGTGRHPWRLRHLGDGLRMAAEPLGPDGVATLSIRGHVATSSQVWDVAATSFNARVRRTDG